jgi:hypothetical protein
MNNKLERIRKEIIIAYFKVPPQHLCEGTEEIHKNLSGQLVSWPRYGPGTFQIRIRGAKHSTTASSNIRCCWKADGNSEVTIRSAHSCPSFPCSVLNNTLHIPE